MQKGYFSIVITIALLLVGLMHLPSVSLHSIEGIFSILWFTIGGVVILANFIGILKIEKKQKHHRKLRGR